MAGGLNLYGYAGGDPINNSDPFGLCPHDPDRPCKFFSGADGAAVLNGLNSFRKNTIGSAPPITITGSVIAGPVTFEFGVDGLNISGSGGIAVAAMVNVNLGKTSGELGTMSGGALAQGPMGTVGGFAVHTKGLTATGATLSAGFGWVPNMVQFSSAKGGAQLALQLADKMSVGLGPASAKEK